MVIRGSNPKPLSQFRDHKMLIPKFRFIGFSLITLNNNLCFVVIQLILTFYEYYTCKSDTFSLYYVSVCVLRTCIGLHIKGVSSRLAAKPKPIFLFDHIKFLIRAKLTLIG